MQVRFESHSSTFLMVYSACENPKCACTNVVVNFIEERKNGQPQRCGLEFGVELDTDTWKVVKLHGANASSNPLIQEFAGVTGDLKEDIQV